MPEENVLALELDKLDSNGLKRLGRLWNLAKLGADKKSLTKNIVQTMQDEFYLKGVLEKLSATQVTIYTSILKAKSSVLTLGEIARKIGMPPVNAEMELGVLKRYYLVYQRKNRERLTNNLDKYHYYPESGDVVRMDTNEKAQKFRLQIGKVLQRRDSVPREWQKLLDKRCVSGGQLTAAGIKACGEDELIAAILEGLSDLERDVILECFLQGGVLELARARELISMKRGKWETVVRHLDNLGLLCDEYYVDEKFIRILVLPQDVFKHIQEHPILPIQKKKKKRQESKANNELDFFLNIRKMIAYISRKGLNLAKSGKIKQIDLRETENRLLRPNIDLFPEKSQINQIELLLPVMRLLDIVRVKGDDVVLRNDYSRVLTMPPLELIHEVYEEMTGARGRRVRYEDVFEPLYVPFFDRQVMDDCVNQIMKRGPVIYFVIIASLIREKLLLNTEFKIRRFTEELTELRREIQSALFYLQLLGFIVVEFPDRHISVSELGLFYLKSKKLNNTVQKGGLIINPDLSMVAIPEMLSLEALYQIKCFAEVKSFDNVYTFQISRESFQEGLLMRAKPELFVETLTECSRGELSQNLLFSIEDWSRTLPLVTITDESVLVQTENSDHMELLLGQIAGKKIVLQKISPTTIIIEQDKIYETITYAEKLNLIVNLIR
ncbi:MAG: helicase-associated domain-containing protein [Leptospiraceae bacterium]|nr:helicase-associated domain-containing protein [Leptospiraceae bacterium]